MSMEAFLSVYNAHSERCGIAPTFEWGDGYLSYFEYEYGEQWVFAMNRESGVFFLCGGDIDWESRQVGENDLKGLVLHMPERMWVLACLQACKLNDVAERLMEARQGFDEQMQLRW